MKPYQILTNDYCLLERQTAKKGKVYDVSFRAIEIATGTIKQKKLSGYKTKKLADKAYFDFVNEYCEYVKTNPLKHKDKEKECIKLSDLLEEYCLYSVREGLKPSTIYSKRKIFDKFVKPYIGDLTIDKLGKEPLQEWLKEIKLLNNPRTQKPYSMKYIINIRFHLSAALNYGEREYGIKNHLAEVAPIKLKNADIKKKSEQSIWKKEDFENFIAVVDDDMWRCIFNVLFYTGRRKGEVLALTKDDIHGESIWFNKSVSRKTLDGTTYNIVPTKEYKSQEIPICKRLQNILKDYRGEEPFFFGGEKPIADNRLRRAFRHYCELAKIPPITIHSLRHSFVSMLVHNGAQIMMIADLIGDEPEQVTKTYGHLYQKDKRKIVEDL